MPRSIALSGSIALAAVGLTAALVRGPLSSKPPANAAGARPGAAATLALASFPISESIPPAKSFRFAKPPGDRDLPDTEAVAPVSLTASDGTGLQLVSLQATGVLEPPLAFTELLLTFENPRDQVIEGRFRI